MLDRSVFETQSALQVTNAVAAGSRIPEEELVGIGRTKNVFREPHNVLEFPVDCRRSNYTADNIRRIARREVGQCDSIGSAPHVPSEYIV